MSEEAVPVGDVNEPKPEHLMMHVVDGMLSVMRHIVDTVPAASGIGPFLTQTQDRFAKLRDMVIPPPKPEPRHSDEMNDKVLEGLAAEEAQGPQPDHADDGAVDPEPALEENAH